MRAESQPIPPKLAPTPSLVFFTMIVLLVVILGSGAVLFFFDPAKHGFYPICLFHVLTGLNCPGCGATRAAYQLLHGRLFPALHDNALFVLALGTLVARAVWLALQKIRSRPVTFTVSSGMLWAFLVIVLVFTGLRNLPAFAWLSP